MTWHELASSQVSPAVLRRRLEALREARLDHQSDPYGERFAYSLRYNTKFLKPEALNRLAEAEIFVVDLPLCTALSKPVNEIVIGNGLLNLIAACGYWGFYAESLPDELARMHSRQFPSNAPIRDLLPLYLFCLTYRHYQYDEPLPDFRALADVEGAADLDRQVANAWEGAAIFIVLHELGHLALGHSRDDYSPLAPSASLTVPQSLSERQLCELEADRYVFDCLRDDCKPLFEPWMNMALNFHLVRETTLGERNRKHPININRLSYASALVRGTAPEPSVYFRHLGTMGGAYGRIEEKHVDLRGRGLPPVLDNLSRDKVIERIRDIAEVAGNLTPNLEVVLDGNRTMPGWDACFAETGER